MALSSALGSTVGAVPAGAVMPFAGANAPAGWLLCGGQAVSRTDYAALFAVIGTTYGAGNGSTTFNLPDLRGRVVAGVDNIGGTGAGRLDWPNTLGANGGAQTHTLSTTEMPSHTHTQNAHTHTQDSHNHSQNAHTHTQDAHLHGYSLNLIHSDGQIVNAEYVNANLLAGTARRRYVDVTNSATATNQNTTATNNATTATNQSTTATNQNTGGNGAHNNMQPTILLNYIIKAVNF